MDPKIPDLRPLALPDNLRERALPSRKGRREPLIQLRARVRLVEEALPFPIRREQLLEPNSRKTAAEHAWDRRWDVGNIGSLGSTYLAKLAQAMLQSDSGDDPLRKFFPQSP